MSKRMLWLMAMAMLPCIARTQARAQAKGEAAAEKPATTGGKTSSIAEKTKAMEKMPGYFNVYWDAKAGQLWLANVVDDVVLYDLMALAANEKASDKVRAVAWLKLTDLKCWLNAPLASRRDISDPAHTAFAVRQMELFEKDPKRLDLTPPAEPPDGPPIGAMGDADEDWRP